MIKIESGSAPDILQSDRVNKARVAAEDFYAHRKATRAQTRHEFDRKIFYEPDLLEALHATFFGKCAFCESPPGVVGDLICGHYRPYDGAVDLAGNFDPDAYWWLAYEWEDLYLICEGCQKSKGNRFPIEASVRARPGARGDALASERPVLIDPRRDQPEDLFVYDQDGSIAASQTRGMQSIEILRLDRGELRKARGRAYTGLQAQLHDLSTPDAVPESTVEPLLDKTVPYAGLRRYVLLRWLEEASPPKDQSRVWEQAAQDPDLPFPDSAGGFESLASKTQATQERFTKYRSVVQSSLGLDTQGAASEGYFLTSRMIEGIEIKNFTVVRDLHLDLTSSDPNRGSWLTLLGENGTGKSSILQAIALALLGKEYRDSLDLDASELVTHGERSGHVRIWLTAMDDPVELRLSSTDPQFEGGPLDPATLLLAYGSTRLLPRPGTEPPRGRVYARVDNLFNPFVPLRDADDWLLGLGQADFNSVAAAIKRVMDLRGDARFRRLTRKGQRRVVVDAFGDRCPLARLSDGYQSVVALATDIMAVMSERWSDMAVAEGLVLIDELGAHLHPEWQMRIVTALREAFPRVQFITTTHSPLCLRGLEDGEVVVMKRDSNDHIFALTDLPSVKGLRVDQLLLSDHFGLLGGTADPAVARTFDEYYSLLAVEKPTDAQRKRLGELQSSLEFDGLAGELPRDRMMYDAIDRYLARRADGLRADGTRTMEADVVRKLNQILDSGSG